MSNVGVMEDKYHVVLALGGIVLTLFMTGFIVRVF